MIAYLGLFICHIAAIIRYDKAAVALSLPGPYQTLQEETRNLHNDPFDEYILGIYRTKHNAWPADRISGGKEVPRDWMV